MVGVHDQAMDSSTLGSGGLILAILGATQVFLVRRSVEVQGKRNTRQITLIISISTILIH